MTLLVQPRGGFALPHCPLSGAFPQRLGHPRPERAAPFPISSSKRRREGPRQRIEAHRWLPGLLAAAVLLSSSPSFSSSSYSAAAAAAAAAESQMDDETFADVPQTLSGGEGEARKRIQKPKSKQAAACTVKCLGTCIRGGAGSPGEGPFNIRRPIVVFKQGFRSRNYCLVECSDICNLIKDGEDGP